jgi:hypothetical protein
MKLVTLTLGLIASAAYVCVALGLYVMYCSLFSSFMNRYSIVLKAVTITVGLIVSAFGLCAAALGFYLGVNTALGAALGASGLYTMLFAIPRVYSAWVGL